MLLLVVVLIVALAVYGIVTNKATPEERDDMLNSNETWP